MNEKTPPDFFVPSELVCVARENLTPELSASGSLVDFKAEKERLRVLLNACEQYSQR